MHPVCARLVHVPDMELVDDSALVWSGEAIMINLPLTQHGRIFKEFLIV